MRCTFTLLDPKLITCDKTVDLGQCPRFACVAPCTWACMSEGLLSIGHLSMKSTLLCHGNGLTVVNLEVWRAA